MGVFEIKDFNVEPNQPYNIENLYFGIFTDNSGAEYLFWSTVKKNIDEKNRGTG